MLSSKRVELKLKYLEVFATASGHRMPNYGEQRIQAKSNNGIGMNIIAQATDVKKPLISVQEMCKKGNHVISMEMDPSFATRRLTYRD